MRKPITSFAMCLAFLSIAAMPGQCAPKTAGKPVRSMLICYFTGVTDYQARSIGAGIGRMLRYRASNLPQLSNLPPLNVVERALRQEKLPVRLSLSRFQAKNIAVMTGQEWAMVGSVRRQAGKVTISVEIYGAASGKMIGTPISVNGPEADLPRLEARLAQAIFSGIGLDLTPQQIADLGKPLTSNPMAIKLLGDYLLASPKASGGRLNTLSAADPGFALAALERINRDLEEGRSQQALIAARTWKHKLPSNRDFASYEFGALLARKRYAEASAVLRRLDTQYPNSFSVTLLRHWLDRLQGNTGGAIEIARKLTQLNPKCSEGYARLAVSLLENTLRNGASLYASRMTSGQAAEFANAVKATCTAGEKAARLDPKYEEMWLVLMASYRESGDYANSDRAYRRLMSLNAGNYDGISSRAINYLCNKDIKSANKLWGNCLRLDTGRPDALVGLALCAKASGDLATADKQMRKALTLDRSCADAGYLRQMRYWPSELVEAAGSLAAKSRIRRPPDKV